jgi:hypothetical protein
MDGERALDTLGVTRGASAEDVRRAYLRRVKAHPPERDPEGFQQAREAYELLKGAPWLFASRAMTVSGPPLESQEPPQAAPVGGVAFTAPAPEPVHPEPAQPFELPPFADVSTDANDRHDDDGNAVSSPPALPAGPDPLERRLAELAEAMRHRKISRAAKLLHALYRLPGVNPDRLPPPYSCIDLLFRLSERRLPKRATSLREAFEAHMERTGVSMWAGLAAKLKLHKEVTAIAQVSERVAIALARAIRREDFSIAASAVQTAYSMRGRAFQSAMEQRAPACWSGVAPYVRVRQAASVATSPWIIRVAIFAALVITRGVFHSPSETIVDSPTTYREAQDEAPKLPVPSELVAPSPAIEPVPTPSERVPTRVGASVERDGTWAAIEAALGYNDCQTALEQWRNMRRASPPRDGAQVARVVHVCPELESLLEEP